MTIKHLYPSAWPTVNFDFANSKALDPRITFTRDSIGTYFDENGILQTAAEGKPRFDHDGETGESLGLLIEEARTNSLKYSEDFSQTSQWQASNLSLDPAPSITAPDGSTNAYKLIENAVNTSHYVRCLPTNQCVPGTTYTYSMFCKAAERTQVVLHFDSQPGSNTYFDLSSGKIVDGTIGTIRNIGNGWYYCSITLNPTSNTEPKFYTAENGSNTTPGGGGVYIWGAQLEEGAFPTSYIPTSGAAVDRSPDLASITGTNFSSWYNQGEGSFIAIADRYDGAFSDIHFTVLTTDGYRLPEFSFRADGKASIYSPDVGSYSAPDSVLKVTFGWSFDGTGASRVINGIGNSVPNTSISDINTALYLGNYFNNPTALHHNGHISRLAYYPLRLSDEQLVSLTS
jgi:hypothetical protein